MGIDPITAGIGASVIGGVAQGSAAKKAAKAQQQAADKQIALQQKIYDETTQRYAPYLDAGTNALAAYNYELGLGPRPMVGGSAPAIETVVTPGTGSTRQQYYDTSGDHGPPTGRLSFRTVPGSPSVTSYRVGGNQFAALDEAQAWANANPVGGTPYGGFQKTPGYDFRLNQGLDAVQSSAAARGGLYSGAAMRDLNKYGQDYATGEYNNYMNRLAGMTDTGMAAAGNQANAGANMGANVGAAYAAQGNAAAAGSIGMGNAINSGITNALGYMTYQNMMGGGGLNSSPRPMPNPRY